jgi:hypothetical protein
LSDDKVLVLPPGLYAGVRPPTIKYEVSNQTAKKKAPKRRTNLRAFDFCDKIRISLSESLVNVGAPFR